MTSQFSNMTPSPIFLALFCFSCKVQLLFTILFIMLVTIITIYFYKELTGNPEIGNISVYVLPNIWRLTKCCRMPGLQLSKFRITPPPPSLGPQSVTGYLRLTLVFVWNGALREGFNCYFSGFFARIYKIFILAGGLGTRLSSVQFGHFPNIS